ncbi:Uncharacterized iron-regulated membrane protein [Alteromonadaceae bacterium Bs31]|nr:Uncharacterized iron-regulated membrane protein [Alteromonadaceae bacterium Bs31]
MASEQNKLYRTLWRWHFYAGIFCIPFIISLSITGAIYLFKPQIDAWFERDMQQLQMVGDRSSPQQQISAAKQSLEGAVFASYRLPEHEQQAVRITLKQAGVRTLVYIHPYTLEILKTKQFDNQFIRIIRSLHGELMLGNFGSVLIELAGCWAIVLIITGLYLWWPRSAEGLAGIIYPRLSQGSRKFWRDLHAVTGFWAAFFTLFLLISGLPWALVWGSAFKEIRSIGQPVVEQDWSISREKAQAQSVDISTTLSVELYQNAQDLNFSHPVEIAPDRAKPTQWKVASGHQNRMLRAEAWYLAESGELLKTKTFSDRAMLDKIIGIGIAAHEGHLFGWLNQLLGLLVTLALILVSVSGFVMWRRRKPSGALGAPPVLPGKHVGRAVFIVTLGLSIVLPVLAMSLLLIVIVEKLLLMRITAVRNWLGLST